MQSQKCNHWGIYFYICIDESSSNVWRSFQPSKFVFSWDHLEQPIIAQKYTERGINNAHCRGGVASVKFMSEALICIYYTGGCLCLFWPDNSRYVPLGRQNLSILRTLG
jgi:hypothetical protein